MDDITRLTLEGKYEPALSAARKLAVDLLQNGKRDEASVTLVRCAEILCRMHHPDKARTFAAEAIDLSMRSQQPLIVAYAKSASAQAHLRRAEYERAERLIDEALEPLSRGTRDGRFAYAQIVAAEIAVAREEYAEARASCEAAFRDGRAADEPWLCATAMLIKAVCEDRVGQPEAALALLTAAEVENARMPDVQVRWMILGVKANLCLKSGRDREGIEARQEARTIIDKIAAGLSPEARERFLQSPAVLSALGEAQTSQSGLWKMPIQVATPPPPSSPSKDDTALDRLRPILDMIKKINSELNLRKLLTTIVDTMIESCNAERGTIVIFDGDRFKVEISRHKQKQDLKRFEMGISRTVLKQIRDQGRMIVIDDAHGSPDFKLTESIHDQGLLSILCVPLRVKTRLVGAVYLDNPSVVGAFGKREIALAEILTDHAAVAIDNALLHIKSIHDGLTSLYNHSHFEKRLESEVARARRHGRSCGLLMVDIDDFKRINDSYGHETGNEVLRQIARLLSATVRNVDLVARVQEVEASPMVARYGGDEFEIVFPDTSKVGLQAAAERILQGLAKEQFFHNGKPIQVGFSLGGAVFPDDAPDARELALRADEALYAAKRSGKNRFCLYGARNAAAQ